MIRCFRERQFSGASLYWYLLFPNKNQSTTSRTWGIMSPLFRMRSFLPTSIPSLSIYDILLRVTRFTVVPQSWMGSSRPTGVNFPFALGVPQSIPIKVVTPTPKLILNARHPSGRYLSSFLHSESQITSPSVS